MRDGKVVRIFDRTSLVIDLGREDGIEPGMRFGIFTPADEIVDRETGAKLGKYRARKAVVQARTVYQRFTVAEAPWRTERVRADLALPFVTRSERVQDVLPVDPMELDPLPGGTDVHVGDPVELLLESPVPSAPAAPAE